MTLKNRVEIPFWLLIIFLSTSIILLWQNITYTLSHETYVYHFEGDTDLSFKLYLKTIQKNCQTTYITRCLNNNKEWCVFVKKCKSEYCKYEYIPLEDCFEEDGK